MFFYYYHIFHVFRCCYKRYQLFKFQLIIVKNVEIYLIFISIQRRTIQKCLNNLYNHSGIITHLELDILEFEIKWVLGSNTTNKASGR